MNTVTELSATLTSGSPVITVASTEGLSVGWTLLGDNGIPYGTYIRSLTPTTITMTNNATQSGRTTIGIGHADGIRRWWVDGRLADEHTDCMWRCRSQQGIEEFTLQIGGGSQALTVDHHWYASNVVFARKRVGPMRRAISAAGTPQSAPTYSPNLRIRKAT
jgi:hypothetical protein